MSQGEAGEPLMNVCVCVMQACMRTRNDHCPHSLLLVLCHRYESSNHFMTMHKCVGLG